MHIQYRADEDDHDDFDFHSNDELEEISIAMTTLTKHYGLRGGVRNFFYVWCEQTLISHLSGYPKPRSKECPLL